MWDPADGIKRVTVAVGEKETIATIDRRAMWVDFEAKIATRELLDGFYTVIVRATGKDGEHSVTEPYLLLTGRQAPYSTETPAVLWGRVERLHAECQVVVNGELAAVAGPLEAGAEVEITIRARHLRRLNTVRLEAPDGEQVAITGVRLEHAGERFLDHHRQFAWGYGSDLATDWRRTDLAFDLEYPGKTTRWAVRSP